MVNRLLFQGIMLLLISLVAKAEPNKLKNQKESTSAKNINIIDFKIFSGKSKIKGTKSEEISVLIEKIEWNNECSLETEKNGKTFVIKVKKKSSLCFFCKSSSCQANFDIELPERVFFNGDSGSGGFLISNINGGIDVSIGSGNLELKLSKASTIKMNIGSGSINLDKTESREVFLKTGSGKIELENFKAKKLSLQTGSGDASLKGEFENINVNIGSGDINIHFEKEPLTGETEIKSGTGNATLYFPKDSKLEIDFHAASGKFSSEFPTVSKQSKHKVKMKSGSGDLSIKSL